MGEAKRKRDYLKSWCRRMRAQHGQYVYWYGQQVGWTIALIMAVYGPGIDNWPQSETRAMWDRAQSWELGTWPDWAAPHA